MAKTYSHLSRGFISAAFLCALSVLVFNKDTQAQNMRFDIQVTLNDQTHSLHGREDVYFVNTSRNTLDTVWFHVWANAYSAKNTALSNQLTDKRNEKLKLRPAKYGGFTDSLNFQSNGTPLVWGYHDTHPDIIYVIPDKPIMPGNSCTFNISFRVKIPDAGVSTFGHRQHEYYITHWYPKPVWVETTGQNPVPFTDQGNIYSPFSDFKVRLTVPASYLVASTGELKTPEELAFLDEKRKQTAAFRANGPAPVNESKKGLKTLEYEALNVNDFAFFASKDFWVDGEEFTLPSGKKVNVYAFYRPKFHKFWTRENEYLKNAITYYSEKIGEYPYSQYTITDGMNYAGADRSYPMVSVIGYKRSRLSLEDITVRMVAESWFSGAVGSDGKQNPWLNEGLSAYYYRRYLREKKPDYNGLPIRVLPVMGLRFLRRDDLDHIPYQYKVRRGNDQPSGLPAGEYPDANYGIAVRGQNAMYFYYLEQYLGTALFDSLMSGYYAQHKMNFSTPVYFRSWMEQHSKKDLSWFFDELLPQKGYLDYAVKRVGTFVNPHTGKKETGVLIQNKGNVAGPFTLTSFQDERIGGATFWMEGFKGEKVFFLPSMEGMSVQIDRNRVIPEVNRKNNLYRTGAVLPRMEKPRFNFIMGPPNLPNRNQVFYLPVTLWNNYNKSMAGIAIHNKTPVRKKFEYLFAPMVSLNPIGFAGVGIISGAFSTPRSKRVESVWYKLAYTRFDYFFDTRARNWNRLMPKIMVNFRPPSPLSERKTQLYARSIFNYLEATDVLRAAYGRKNLAFNVNEIGFSMRDNRLLYPYQLLVWAEYIVELDKFSKPGVSAGSAIKLSAEFRQKITYLSANKGLDIRMFAGTFAGEANTVLDYRYRLSGHPGFWDYKFDNYYLGRADTRGLSSRQFYEYDGGFKVLTPLGQTDRWMIAMNLKASVPGPVPIKPYIDLAVFRQVVTDAGTGNQIKSVNFSYSGGVMMSVINDVLEIFVPLYHSEDIRDYLAFADIKWYNRIRFRLNMQELNPRRIREKLEWWPR
jgi:hypothetical protein